MQRSPLRAIVGFFFSGFGGLSLTIAILPMALAAYYVELESTAVMFQSRYFGVPLAILWAICGAATGWQGGTLFGGTVLGLCGVLSGFVLGAFALNGDMALIFISILTGLIYGGIAGLILGKAFPDEAPKPQ